MEKVKYELQLDGTIQQGFPLATAVEELTRLFRNRAEWFRPLLDGQPVSRVIYITPEQAEKLRTFLAAIGLQGQILPEGPQTADAPLDLVAMAGMDVAAAAAPLPDTPAEPARANQGATDQQQAEGGGSTLQLVPVDEETGHRPASAGGTGPETVCPKCGVEQEPAEQCSACGIFFAKYRAQHEGVPAGEPVATTTANPESGDGTSTLEEDMLAYVRENGHYYDGRFDACRAASDRFRPGWHWSGFFFPFHWALYRKLWLWAAALFVVPVLLAPLMPLFSLVLINVLFATSANFIYYRHVKHAVTGLRARRKATAGTLAKAGGTSWPAVVAGVLLPLVFSGVLMSWMMPDGFTGLQAMQSAYDAQDPKVMKTRQGQETFMTMSMAKLAIGMMMQQGKIRPREVSYERLVDGGMPANNLIDGWGTPFRIDAQGRDVSIASAGPDREFDTGDDLKQ
jgi:hypothetical protein